MKKGQRYKDIHLVQLRSFCLVATQGNFTAAAEALGLSKATVWQQVRALERLLGAVFLRRRGRTVELTPEGRLLLEKVQPHVHGLDSLATWFASRRAELPQCLTVASVPYLLAYHLTTPIQEFAGANPSVQLNLCAEPWEEVLRMVEQGETDLAVVPYPRDQSPSRNLDYLPLFDLHFSLLAARNHPLTRKKSLTLADVVRHPLIQPQDGSLTKTTLDLLLRKHRLVDEVRWVLVSRTVDMTRRFTALGVGVALEYVGLAARPLMPDIHVRIFAPEVETVPVAVVTRRFAHLSAAAEEFRRNVVRHCTAVAAE